MRRRSRYTRRNGFERRNSMRVRAKIEQKIPPFSYKLYQEYGNHMQGSTFLVKFVPGMQFRVFDFALHASGYRMSSTGIQCGAIARCARDMPY
eukprot:3216307-Rhodomonas_salina.3